MNKILLFTHKVDIDGMGSVVLSNLAFKEVDVIFCETFEVDKLFNEKLKTGKLYNYDYIFITDICLSENLIKEVSLNTKLLNKIAIFDHHKIEMKNINNYNFITLKIEDRRGLCCGTSLFFDYLVSNKLLKETDAVLKFVELTRQYDTWEWKHIYHNEEANELNLLFNILGREKYISMVLSHLKNADVFEFSKDEILLIENFKKEISDLCEKYVSAMKIKEIDGFVVGVIENVEHRCRNDISEVVKLKNIKLDYIAFTLKDRDTVSFRSIKKDVDVSVVAVKFGGKGHSNASSCPKSEIVNKYLFE